MLSWLNAMPSSVTDTHKEVMTDLFDRMIPPCLEFVRKSGVKVIDNC